MSVEENDKDYYKTFAEASIIEPARLALQRYLIRPTNVNLISLSDHKNNIKYFIELLQKDKGKMSKSQLDEVMEMMSQFIGFIDTEISQYPVVDVDKSEIESLCGDTLCELKYYDNLLKMTNDLLPYKSIINYNSILSSIKLDELEKHKSSLSQSNEDKEKFEEFKKQLVELQSSFNIYSSKIA